MNLQFTYLDDSNKESFVTFQNTHSSPFSLNPTIFNISKQEYYENRSQDFNNIIPGLHVGNENSGVKYGNQFDLVVNCTPDVPFHSGCKGKIRIPVHDDPSEIDKMYNLITNTQVLEKMHEVLEKNESVLVHCHQGISRSCTIVASYLIKYKNMTPGEAVQYIKSKRPIAFHFGVHFKKLLNYFYKTKQQNMQ